MIAYKGFNRDLESIHGNGRKECCTFTPGVTYKEASSKTRNTGFHCCENPFECLTYYQLDGNNRFFQVEAEGDINEDQGGRIACTELTLIRELSRTELAFAGMEYLIHHPRREKWEQNHRNVKVQKDRAEVEDPGAIAIARGVSPSVKGPKGSILGLIVEPVPGEIAEAKLFRSSGDAWMEFGEGRTIREVRDEKEAG